VKLCRLFLCRAHTQSGFNDSAEIVRQILVKRATGQRFRALEILRRIEKEREDPDDVFLAAQARKRELQKQAKILKDTLLRAAAQTQEALSARLLLDEPSHNHRLLLGVHNLAGEIAPYE
jgi:hypothetical protein